MKPIFNFMALILSMQPFWAHADAPIEITLDQALRMALESDERIEIQQRQVAIAGRDVNRAWTIISPRLALAGRYERPENEIRRNGDILVPEDRWVATINATQPLFDGRVTPAYRAGRAEEGAAMHQLAHAIRTSLFRVSQTYYGVLSARKQVEVAEQTLELTLAEVDRAQARFDAGEARRTEVLRAEVDEARARRNLVAARNAYDVALADLARRIGLPADQSFELTEPAVMPEAEFEDLAILFEEALERRSDLAAARLLVVSAREQGNVLRREAWPTVDLQFTHSFSDPDSPQNPNNSWTAAAVARFEFWDGGNRRISRLQQEDRAYQAMLQARDLEKTIQLEVQQALLDLHNVRENLTALRKEVDLAEENFRTLSEQARVGLATSLDVSTALTELTRARIDLTRQEFDFEVAKQGLDQAVGRFASDFVEVEE